MPSRPHEQDRGGLRCNREEHGATSEAPPEPLSQEVLERIASEYPEAVRAEAAQVLLDYRQAPVNFGRLRVLGAARGNAADLARLVEVGNRYGQDWVMGGRPTK